MHADGERREEPVLFGSFSAEEGRARENRVCKPVKPSGTFDVVTR